MCPCPSSPSGPGVIPRPLGPTVNVVIGPQGGPPHTGRTRPGVWQHEEDSDDEGLDKNPRVTAKHVVPLKKTVAIAKTLDTPKPQAAAQQRHNEVIGLLNVLTAKMDGMQEQIRVVQTDVKILKESVAKTGSIGPSSGVYTRPHY